MKQCIITILLFCTSFICGQPTAPSNEDLSFSFSALEQGNDIEVLRFSNYRKGSNLKHSPKLPDYINGMVNVVRRQIQLGLSATVPQQSLSPESNEYNEELMSEYSIIYGIHNKPTGSYFFRIRQMQGKQKAYSIIGFNLINNQVTPLASTETNTLWEWVVANLKYKQFNRLFQGIYASNEGVKSLRKRCSDEELSISLTSLHCMLETLYEMEESNQRVILDKLNK